jgi:hypothetical protein
LAGIFGSIYREYPFNKKLKRYLPPRKQKNYTLFASGVKKKNIFLANWADKVTDKKWKWKKWKAERVVD